MKKTYIIPHVNCYKILDEKPIAESGVSSNNGIDYGGVDEDGKLDPSVKDNSFADDFFDFNWE